PNRDPGDADATAPARLPPDRGRRRAAPALWSAAMDRRFRWLARCGDPAAGDRAHDARDRGAPRVERPGPLVRQLGELDRGWAGGGGGGGGGRPRPGGPGGGGGPPPPGPPRRGRGGGGGGGGAGGGRGRPLRPRPPLPRARSFGPPPLPRHPSHPWPRPALL